MIEVETKNAINKMRWERWRAQQDKDREKTYFYCWADIDWDCVSACVIGDCLGAVIEYISSGQVPGNSPPICAVCIVLLADCY